MSCTAPWARSCRASTGPGRSWNANCGSARGVALNLAEQERLVADLGQHPALILRNHGLLTVGETPGEAFLRMYYLNRACEIQTTALAGGVPLVLPDPDVSALAARQLTGTDESSDLQDDQANDLAWAALLRLASRIAPDHVN